MAVYAEQVLVSTGRDDWKSRIEEEDEADFVRELKGLLGRGGKFCDPYYNIALTNSSFSPTDPSSGTSAYLLPSFLYVPAIPTSKSSIENFVKAFLQPADLHNTLNVLSPEQKKLLTGDPSLQQQFLKVVDVDDILVLICGHNGRDRRCGIMGPLLRSEFEEKLRMKGITPPTGTPVQGPHDKMVHSARVGLISHIGGHKFAGNVIIYLPPSMKSNALAGTGIWYGRVSPEHVEGIVNETILGGKVISSMFRGGIKKGGELLRL